MLETKSGNVKAATGRSVYVSAARYQRYINYIHIIYVIIRECCTQDISRGVHGQNTRS